jgi:hypothetical protein
MVLFYAGQALLFRITPRILRIRHDCTFVAARTVEVCPARSLASSDGRTIQ